VLKEKEEGMVAIVTKCTKGVNAILLVSAPAKSEQRSAEQNEWHIVRTVGGSVRGALTDHERRDQGRKAGSDMNWRAAREIESAHIPKPPAAERRVSSAARCVAEPEPRPNPMCHKVIPDLERNN
jgi:hypothetical protein